MSESAAPWRPPGGAVEEFLVLVPCRTVLPLGLRDMVPAGHPELFAYDDEEAAPNIGFRDDHHQARPADESPCAHRVPRVPFDAGRTAAVAEHDRDCSSGSRERRSSVNWKDRPVLVPGGASFIGSHMVDALIERGAAVRLVDDLTSGQLENIKDHIDNGRVEFIRGDLKMNGLARKVVDGMSVVFHLAADHGGRGYVELHQSACALNMMLDQLVFDAAAKARVDKVVFASSGCVDPNELQTDPSQTVYLTEDLVGPPYDADNMYGWAKLMGEMTLRAYCKDWGFKAASCRYFTVYGNRGHENHAVIAMIARAFLKQDPFDVWGNGEQIRNWTHVSDIVAGTIRAAEKIDDGTAVNLGTMERTRVIDAVRAVLAYTGHTARIRFLLDKPVGPMNRVADNTLAKRLLEWEPQVKFIDGLHRTIDWYFAAKDRATLAADLERKLTER